MDYAVNDSTTLRTQVQMICVASKIMAERQPTRRLRRAVWNKQIGERQKGHRLDSKKFARAVAEWIRKNPLMPPARDHN